MCQPESPFFPFQAMPLLPMSERARAFVADMEDGADTPARKAARVAKRQREVVINYTNRNQFTQVNSQEVGEVILNCHGRMQEIRDEAEDQAGAAFAVEDGAPRGDHMLQADEQIVEDGAHPEDRMLQAIGHLRRDIGHLRLDLTRKIGNVDARMRNRLKKLGQVLVPVVDEVNGPCALLPRTVGALERLSFADLAPILQHFHIVPANSLKLRLEQLTDHLGVEP